MAVNVLNRSRVHFNKYFLIKSENLRNKILVFVT